jgi:hypothetical protein
VTSPLPGMARLTKYIPLACRAHCLNKRCSGNWYEDRLATPRTNTLNDAEQYSKSSPRLDVRKSEPSSFRTQTVDIPQSVHEPYLAADTMRTSRTTTQDMDSRLGEVRWATCCTEQLRRWWCDHSRNSQVLRPKQRPQMVNCENLRQTCQMERQVPGPLKGFGTVVPRHPDANTEARYLSTNKVCPVFLLCPPARGSSQVLERSRPGLPPVLKRGCTFAAFLCGQSSRGESCGTKRIHQAARENLRWKALQGQPHLSKITRGTYGACWRTWANLEASWGIWQCVWHVSLCG